MNIDDLRLKHFIEKENSNPRVVIIGFPSDEGVKRNGGRPGAATAPDEIRQALFKLTPDSTGGDSFEALLSQTRDAGNIQVSGNLETDQEALGDIVAEYIKQEVVPIVIGGGHETAFGHFLGYAKAGLKTSIFNLDAHTDVRPLKKGKAHSGSPFRQALEHKDGCCELYSVAGLQPHSVAKSHLEFIKKYDGNALFKNETNIESIKELLSETNERCMVTFDMDAVDQAFAPGVSAPCTNGLHPELWLQAAYQAGKTKTVTSFDISEMNPIYDRDDQTAKLAALTVWYFLKGLNER